MGNKIQRIMMRVANTAKLPSSYQEVEYIENNGTAYILTGLNIKDGYRNQMKVRFLVAANADTYPGISGGYLGADSGLPGGHGRFYLNGLQTNGKLNYGYLSSYGDIGSGLATGTDYEIDYSWISGNAFVKLNGNTLQSSSATYSTSLQGQAPIGGGAHMDLNQYWANPGIRIYYSKFYNSVGTLVRDFVPCYRKSDNVIGMYDLVNGQFYTNSGTGTFTKGNDVSDMVEKQVRPTVYEYSYDFRNKSSTILTNDGWTVGSGTTIDSNGITSSSYSSTTHLIGHSITNAKKLILTCGLYNANGTNSSYGLRATKSSVGTHYISFYVNGYDSGQSSLALDGANIQTFSQTEPSGQSEWIYTLDFENLTYKLEYAGVTKSGTMTQTQADNIRNNNTAIRLAVQYGTGRIQYVKIEVSL